MVNHQKGLNPKSESLESDRFAQMETRRHWRRLKREGCDGERGEGGRESATLFV